MKMSLYEINCFHKLKGVSKSCCVNWRCVVDKKCLQTDFTKDYKITSLTQQYKSSGKSIDCLLYIVGMLAW